MVMGMPSAVMDLPTPRDISMVFVKQYYTLLNEAPDHVHRFYSQNSSFVHGGLERGKKSETKTAMGQKEINDRIQKLQFRDARTKIKQVDAHPTLAGGVVIQVSGQLSNNGAPMRPFMQTFVLAPQTAHNYYVYNDIFRYQDDLFSDDEDGGDGAAEADDEAEPESPPVPPPAAPAPATAPTAPATAAPTAPPPTAAPEQPVAPAAPAPVAAPSAAATATAAAAPAAPAGYGQPAHVNGHGATGAAPQPTPPASPPPPPPAAAAPTAAQTAAPEPAEPAESAAADSPPPRQPSPPARQPSPPPPPPPVSNEPKTYANLLKASSGRPAAPRPAPADKDQSPPSRPVTAAAAAPAARPQPSAVRPEPTDAVSSPATAMAGGDGVERRRFGGQPDSHQIFVGNLPQDITESELTDHFRSFGEVVGVKIHTSKPATKGVAPRSYPNYGFVVFDSAEAVQRVLQEMPVKLSRQGGDEGHRLNIEKKQQQRPPGEGRGRGDRPSEGRGRGFYSRGAPRGRAGYGRGGEPRGGRGGYQSGPRR